MLTVKIRTDQDGSCGECIFKVVSKCRLFPEDTKFVKDGADYFKRCPSKSCPLYDTQAKSFTWILAPEHEVLP